MICFFKEHTQREQYRNNYWGECIADHTNIWLLYTYTKLSFAPLIYKKKNPVSVIITIILNESKVNYSGRVNITRMLGWKNFEVPQFLDLYTIITPAYYMTFRELFFS